MTVLFDFILPLMRPYTPSSSIFPLSFLFLPFSFTISPFFFPILIFPPQVTSGILQNSIPVRKLWQCQILPKISFCASFYEARSFVFAYTPLFTDPAICSDPDPTFQFEMDPAAYFHLPALYLCRCWLCFFEPSKVALVREF